MAKVFYDRSGKAHTIGKKDGTEEVAEKKPNAGPKGFGEKKRSFDGPSRPAESRGDSKPGGKKFFGDRPYTPKKPSGTVGGGKSKSSPHKKRTGDPRYSTDDRARQEFRDARSSAPKGEGKFAPDSGGARGVARAAGRAAGKPKPETRSAGPRGAFQKDAGRKSSSPWADKAPARGGGGNRFGAKTGRGGDRPAGRGGNESRGGRAGGRSGGGKYDDQKKQKQYGRERGPRRPVTINPDWIKLKGVIDKNKKGSAFLVFDRRDLEDIFIPRYYVDQLFHGDRVEAYISEAGEIEDLKVTEHRFKEIFGRVYLDERPEHGKNKAKARVGFLVYERKRAKEEIYLPSVPLEVKEGDWVKAEIIFGEDEASGNTGAISAKILEVIGPMLPASYDIQMVAGEFNLTEHHTFDAVKQAESFTLEIPGKDELGRTDLRHIPFMTIDGERARDFDDAIYVERTENKGFRLWVAIADVSHYVKIGTALDREAYARATSVYFPERAFHMLPRALSEELCSLKPNVPRLTMACSIDYTAEGEKGEIKMFDGIIESRRRATYNEIEAEKADPKHADMFALYRVLREQRKQRGSIDFDFPEAEIILDEKTGEPSDIVVRERNDAHRLIEEFMIRANESVTEWMMERQLPFIYRVHDEPSTEAIEKFKKLAKNMGVQLYDKGASSIRPKVLADFIHKLKDHPAEIVLATALLRSMRQAVYSADHGEHFGLASEGYTHFTSPIRRYPDLIVHRQLRAALHRDQNHEARPSDEDLQELQKQLAEMAEHCSYRERIASEAERESIRFKSVRLMSKHIGEEFDGKVNGLTERGMFVQLYHPYCEGMVSVDSMGDDFYEFSEERMMLSGRRSKQSFQIGQKVRIQVVRVDLDARQVEFELRDSEPSTDQPIKGSKG